MLLGSKLPEEEPAETAPFDNPHLWRKALRKEPIQVLESHIIF